LARQSGERDLKLRFPDKHRSGDQIISAIAALIGGATPMPMSCATIADQVEPIT
jgi:hypothetical protein